MNIRMLINESVILKIRDQSIGLAGVDDPHYFGLQNLTKANQSISGQKTKILLAHSPELFKTAQKIGFDLYLTGHTHGGQICLLGGIILMNNSTCSRKFSKDSWKFKNMKGYTSRGVGASGIPVRFFCPPEMTIHHLHRSSA